MLPKEDGFKVPETRVTLNCERRNQQVSPATRGKYAPKKKRGSKFQDLPFFSSDHTFLYYSTVKEMLQQKYFTASRVYIALLTVSGNLA